MKRNRSLQAPIGDFSGQAWATAVPPIINAVSIRSISGANSDD